MRFLGVGDSCELAALYLRLQAEGHEVRVSIAEQLCRDILSGLITRIDDWRSELDWIKAAGEDGIILFENVAEQRGAIQDELRADGFNVVGGSAFGDRLETNRAYAQRVLADLGLKVAPVREFKDFESAARHIDKNPGRHVLKFNDPAFGSADNYIGFAADGADTKAVLKTKLAQAKASNTSFILMPRIEGIEMGVGAYFDGERFIGNACLDWEHKHFFPGDMGELTGEMGTIVTYDRTRTFFKRTLEKIQPLLREHKYCGYINLNTIVNEEGVWPLEFTCRFGYPGFAILTPLQETAWSALFKTMMTRRGEFRTRRGFCAGIVLTTPPFPYARENVPSPVGIPVLFEALSEEEKQHLHFGEVRLAYGQLVTAGGYGWTMVVTGTGATIDGARRAAVQLAGKVQTASLRYRTDIGAKLVAGDFAGLERLGLLDGT
jgi:phosphoribosylamine---glycine ligase